ncbi:MAG: peptidase [Herbinix sp.]|nr:peptidase [Herbinix sp.]
MAEIFNNDIIDKVTDQKMTEAYMASPTKGASYLGNKINSKKKWIAGIIGTIFILAVFYFSMLYIEKQNAEKPKRLMDTEFSADSKIRINNLSSMQEENLYTLAKVWGFAKYRHPSITNGDLNWDMELFRVMPEILEAKTKEDAQNGMVKWLKQFPFEISEVNEDYQKALLLLEEQKILEADLSWIEDKSLLGADLSSYLKKLNEVKVLDTSKAYAVIPDNDFRINMGTENNYSRMKPEDSGMRLLSLFRYWNIIEYFYPYKDIIEEDWNQVLHRMIPVFLQGKDQLSYVLATSELTTFIHDSHAYFRDNQNVLNDYFGTYMPAVEFLNIDGDIVISKVALQNNAKINPLQPGDIIISMDGISIEDRIENCRKYLSLSDKDRFVNVFRFTLLGSKNQQAEMEILRGNEEMTLTVSCTNKRQILSGNEKSELIEDGRIGYINPGTLKKGQIDKLMRDFEDTEGLIIDLRNYPTDFIVYSLAEYLIPEITPFVKFGFCNPLIPSSFSNSELQSSGSGLMKMQDPAAKDKPLYKGRIIILMDERTQSQAEFTVMSLRNAPDAVVIGSPSVGADGDVVQIKLPGVISTNMTGLSIFYPNGQQTQRVGLEPDIYVTPTLEGLREKRDELLEKAISIISEAY